MYAVLKGNNAKKYVATLCSKFAMLLIMSITSLELMLNYQLCIIPVQILFLPKIQF